MSVSTRRPMRVRRDFSPAPPIIDIPDLIEIQKRSWDRFLQAEVPAEERKDHGLQSVFSSVFPISDYNGMVQIEFVGYALGDAKYDVRECLHRGMTYAAPLRIRVRMVVWEKNPDTGAKTIRDVKEQEVYLGDLPLMTENGTFIINGTERVIVSQLHRSPGVFFNHDKGKTHASGKIIFSARVIPYRGSWLDFEFDAKDILFVRIDRRRKFPATVLLRALGHNTEALLREFYPVETVKFHGKGATRVINHEILAGLKAAASLKDKKTGEVLVKEGAKITRGALKRLEASGTHEIPILPEEIAGRIVLKDIVDKETGEVLVPANERIAEPVLDRLMKGAGESIELLFIDGVRVLPALRDTLLQDRITSPEDAMLDIYRKLRPGEPPTLDTARSLFENLFFNDKRYDLSSVGRLKINKKVGIDISLETRVLTKADIVEIVRYLLNLRAGRGEIDDIDHLGNRRVRSVGELLENQFRIGLVRMERMIRERMGIQDLDQVLPHDLINAKPVTAAIKEFFGSSQLSQFMDQTNPLAEITHKRRLSALGPGGLTRERAGFEVRDVHPTHYGRICPIETPEGPNIGLITSLATYARVNDFGFIETPYRKVESGRVTDEIDFLSAIDGEQYVIAPANTPIDGRGRITAKAISARVTGDFRVVTPEQIQYMDVSPKQIVSVAAALIPFLENDDANRALMGSNMQRQAVPLLRAEAPLVGTGMERVAARDSGAVAMARRPGVVESVDATRIVVRAEVPAKKRGGKEKETVLDVYNLIKFYRSNQNTCVNQKPIVRVGEKIKKGTVLADGPSTDLGELALGRNAMVAFMPWNGNNFEDAILISERLVKDDRFTSVHIEEFEVEARDTKLGKEEITRDIPNVGEEALRNLDESGIIRIGAEVRPGDILVGKVTPKGETQLTPEEKLLRAIFGEKAADVRDASLMVPPGIEGVVVDVKVFSRTGIEKDERAKSIESDDIERLRRDYQDEVRIVEEEKYRKFRKILAGKTAREAVIDPRTGETIVAKGRRIEEEHLARIADKDLQSVSTEEPHAAGEDEERIEDIEEYAEDQLQLLETIFDEKMGRLKRGDELQPGVLKLVRVYVAMKRKIQVGDKVAGRHGNKGVIARVLPEEDMPFLPDGRPVEIVLNPLGVPSRMNVGQVLEAHLGWAAHALGLWVSTPVFEGAREQDIKEMLKEAGLPASGQSILRDGLTGDLFDRPVTVGHLYTMKLHHLVDDKIHARSIGPYSLVTQQPLGGKAQFGGQRLGEMEVWALQAYGSAYTLQEFLTVKSDDTTGRTKIYEAIVKGKNTLEAGLPESFNVLIKELQSLGLDVELISARNREEAETPAAERGAAASI